jgi:hypothetical protein
MIYLGNENYKTLMKETEENTKKVERHPIFMDGRISIKKCPYHPK